MISREDFFSYEPDDEDAVRVYEAKRFEYYTRFEDACHRLIKHIIELIPDLERNWRQILKEEKNGASGEEFTGVQELFKGIRSKQTTVVEGKVMSMEVEGGHLTLQLNYIKIAATDYTITHDDDERMRYEHTLVRAGADLRDMIYDRLGSSDPKYLAESNYNGLKKFCSIYEEMLMAYDTMAALKKPGEEWKKG
jgi:hypothetical protein